MFKLFFVFRKNKIWDFNGGIYLLEMKIQFNGIFLCQVFLVQCFVILLKQYIGVEGELCVSVGDKVLCGQLFICGCGKMLFVYVFILGIVTVIVFYFMVYFLVLVELSVIIDVDGEDCWILCDGWVDYCICSCEELIECIYQFGVVGLGGVGFLIGVKLQGGGDKIEMLIINVVECELYIIVDDCLMQDCVVQVVEGICIFVYILQLCEIFIGIEDNKLQVIFMLCVVLVDFNDIFLWVILIKYFFGGVK